MQQCFYIELSRVSADKSASCCGALVEPWKENEREWR
jgi:hypothetical protein